MNNKGVQMTDEDKGQRTRRVYPEHKNVTCYKCGKKGHYANKCPSGDSNDEASTRSSPSIGWSGWDDGLTLLEARSMIPQKCVG
jgi:hypothetical protein